MEVWSYKAFWKTVMTETYTRIQIKTENDICRVAIHRPDDRNSIDSTLMKELHHLLDKIEKSTSRAIIFSGAGETYFIGGADGIEMMQCNPSEAKDFSTRIQNLFNRMETSPLIMVAAINGLCFGGGFEFALACDYRIAAKSAKIGLPEVKVGIIPGGGGTQRLSRLVGTGRAMEMILSGRLYDAQKAFEYGLVHRINEDAALEYGAGKMLEPVLNNPPHAISQAKLAVKASQNLSFSDGLRIETENFGQCFKKDYFVDLMCRQLREGVLKTTGTLPDHLCDERSP